MAKLSNSVVKQNAPINVINCMEKWLINVIL